MLTIATPGVENSQARQQIAINTNQQPDNVVVGSPARTFDGACWASFYLFPCFTLSRILMNIYM